jgi:hypothetical protein
MFFHFQLNSIADVKPWGQKDKPVLHWFGLSNGRYWIQVGETELFRYNKALLAAYPPQDPVIAAHPLRPYVNYYVVRLWEDILAIMPDIVDPLPAPLLQRLEPIDKWLQWCQKAQTWREDAAETCSDEDSDARDDIHDEALSWWWDRYLYTGPILPSPGIYFWSDGQLVHCLWDSRDPLPEDGIDTWESVYGTASMSTSTFMESITSFNTRFIAAMAERVQIVLADWSRPEITLDFDQLASEQVQRSEHFARCMAAIPTRAKTVTDWERVIKAIQAIENDPDFLALAQS